MTAIIVKIENVNGKEKIYPVCDKAKAFARIAGTKTLTRDIIKAISDSISNNKTLTA